MRRIVVILIVLQMFFGSAAAFAQETKGVAPQTEGSLNTKVAVGEGPIKSLEKEADYRDPINYPLIGEGGYVDSLLDSYSNYQYIYFQNITDSDRYYDYMKVKLAFISQDAYNKDNYLTVEYYKEDNNYLTYVASSDFYTYGYSSANMSSHIPISYFDNEQYLYMRVGVRQYSSDSSYSDVTTFKVNNPYYSSNIPGSDDSYAVISNESTNASATEPTGTFSINNKNYSMNKNLKPSSYKIDVNLPFDSASNKTKGILKNEKSILPSYNVGDSKYFWVSNLSTNSHYQITARLAYSGTKANVWVNNNEITDADAAKLGTEFDSRIYSSVTNNFGQESDVNGDGKINILTYDIQDGFSGSGGYVAGYFWGGDLYNVSYSNQSEIFYLDTYPTMGTSTTKNVAGGYETLAHEFQHMVNFNRNSLVEGSSSMETWINEALSMAAEQIYTGNGLSSRMDYYNASSSIQNGHSLLYWDNAGDVLSNYSLSYLFGQYIKIQMGQGNRIFKEIINDPNNNYVAIENAAKKYISPNMTFGQLMTNFRIALLMKEPTGLYGFKGDPFFDSLQNKIYSGSSSNLRGGGSVVTTFNSAEGLTIPSDKGANITYTTLAMGGGSGKDETPPAAPVVDTVTDQSTIVKGTTEALAGITVMAGTNVIGSGSADNSGQFSVTIPKQKSGTKLSVTARDSAGNESTTVVTVITSYKKIKIQLNRKDFTAGYFGNGTTYVHWKALDTFKIPYTYKGGGVFTVEGRTVQGEYINGGVFIPWSKLSPGKVTYKVISGGYNFIYATPTKIQLNGKNFNQGYFKDGTTYVYWKALETFKIPYTYKGNGLFIIDGRTVQGTYINGAVYISWSLLAPGKVTYKTISGGYNFIYPVPLKIQLNGKSFTPGYAMDGTTYVYWKALETFGISYTYKGKGLFIIEGRSVQGQYINGTPYIRWNLLAPGKITYQKIDGGFNFIYTP